MEEIIQKLNNDKEKDKGVSERLILFELMHDFKKQRDDLLEICKLAFVGAKHNACGYDDPDPTWHCCDWNEVAEKLEKVIQKYGDDN